MQMHLGAKLGEKLRHWKRNPWVTKRGFHRDSLVPHVAHFQNCRSTDRKNRHVHSPVVSTVITEDRLWMWRLKKTEKQPKCNDAFKLHFLHLSDTLPVCKSVSFFINFDIYHQSKKWFSEREREIKKFEVSLWFESFRVSNSKKNKTKKRGTPDCLCSLLPFHKETLVAYS